MDSKKQSKPKNNSKQFVIFAVAAVLLVAGIAWYAVRPAEDAGSTTSAPATSQSVASRPVTLSPAMFSDDPKAQAAYQVAKDIPEVLEQLPCFCGCMHERGHKSNLYCFSDEHGSICDVCENIALDAKSMHDRGMSTDQIKESIIQKYSRT